MNESISAGLTTEEGIVIGLAIFLAGLTLIGLFYYLMRSGRSENENAGVMVPDDLGTLPYKKEVAVKIDKYNGFCVLIVKDGDSLKSWVLRNTSLWRTIDGKCNDVIRLMEMTKEMAVTVIFRMVNGKVGIFLPEP